MEYAINKSMKRDKFLGMQIMKKNYPIENIIGIISFWYQQLS